MRTILRKRWDVVGVAWLSCLIVLPILMILSPLWRPNSDETMIYGFVGLAVGVAVWLYILRD